MSGRAVVVEMTEHFLRRWRERVGAKPTLKGLNRMLSGALQIRRQERVWRRRGRLLEEYKLLAEYWAPASQLIIRVDSERRAAVTVISGKECCRKDWGHARPIFGERAGDESDK